MPEAWLPVALAFLAGGLVKGAVGLGLPTVVLAGLAPYMPISQAAAILVIPSLVTNVWQLFGGPWPARSAWRLAPLLLGLVVGTLLAPVGMATVNTHVAALCLGGSLVAYAAVGLANRTPSLPAGAERWASPVLGLACGVINAATGLFVVPLVPYVQSLGMVKDELVQALALCFTAGALALALRLGMDGTSVLAELRGSVLALVAALLGMPVGKALRDRSSQQVFRNCLFAVLLAVGAGLIAKGLLA
ncbi:MAG: hypothetical protein DI563_00630 [Variovorax paradoxus]|uniref:Probable membrane transporter protein n=1 Tax=Variovorax paradoxus TaxID=34073 RepID=A0A2W5QMS3_VARPD|nr:MAG: hypothetical protein DI563_00630 [Variovorax paradoxus]